MNSKEEESLPNVAGTLFRDASTIWKGFLSLKAFWYDMRCRPRSWAHKATLCLGLLEIVAAVGFCIALHLHHAPFGEGGRVCIDQLTMVLGIAGLSQGFLTANGICMENAAMLIFANLNGMYILGYLAMHLKHVMIARAADITVVCVFAVFSILHLAFSVCAWGGDFNRFIFFRVGGDEHTVRRYRFYELLLGSLLLDLIVTITTCGNLMFMVDGMWWEYLVLVIGILLACLAQAAVRISVRYEKPLIAALAFSLQLAVAATCAVALWHSDFLGVTFSSICNQAPIVMFGIMIGTHTLCSVSFLCCASFFGSGMKTVFSNERAAIDFVTDNYERHQLLSETFLS